MDLIQCICGGGDCTSVCSDNVCVCADASPECSECIHDMQSDCGQIFADCANDL